MTSAPWESTLSDPQHAVISFFLLFAALALAVGVIRAWMTREEIGVRYRTASVARASLMTVAALAYVLININFQLGYAHTAMGWVPNESAVGAFAPRYIEWAITVPLLIVELFAVTVIVGSSLRRLRAVAAVGALVMVFAGYLGGVVSGGDDTAQLIIWGSISAVFWLAVTGILLFAVRASSSRLTPGSADVLRDATTLLLSGWVIYPIVFVLQIVAHGPLVTTIVQVTLCIADVAIKLGFGGLTHRVAKLRTAEDVRAGEDVHPEAIWISSEKQSDAGSAREVYLDSGSVVHDRRPKPADSSAVAAPLDPPDSEFDYR